ncbi:MAG: hypothetical protein MZV64_14940 [Ignavibacteriales bacterium]|nr:hypothetical protein [Ignavibacteriales bacterium]
MVGIYNTPERLEEYSDSVKGKNYMKFMVEQLKPFIDKYYRNYARQGIYCDNGFLDGRADLISACMELSRRILEKPHACQARFIMMATKQSTWLEITREKKKKIKIYIDHGEDGLPRGQKMFCELSQKGYLIGTDVDYYYSRRRVITLNRNGRGEFKDHCCSSSERG